MNDRSFHRNRRYGASYASIHFIALSGNEPLGWGDGAHRETWTGAKLTHYPSLQQIDREKDSLIGWHL